MRSVRFTPRRSHRALGQTVDNLVPTIFQTAQLSCRKAPRRIPRRCPRLAGPVKGNRKTHPGDVGRKSTGMKKEHVVKIKGGCSRNNGLIQYGKISRNKKRKDKSRVGLLAGASGRCSILGIELGPGLSSHAGVVRVAQVQGHNGR